MSTGPAAPTRPRSRWRRRLLYGLVILLGLLGPPVGFHVWHAYSSSRELREALEELDGTEPGWRLEDLEASRPTVVYAKNSALVVLAVGAKLPAGWDRDQPFDIPMELAELHPTVRLDEKQATFLRGRLNKVRLALAQVCKLNSLERGRYAVNWTPDGYSTLLPHLQQVRDVGGLLDWDATLKAQDSDFAGAWESARLVLLTGRSVGDEPCFVSYLVRKSVSGMAVYQMQRVLAQGEVSAASLESTQKLLEDEGAIDLMTFVTKGERASLHRLFSALADGTVKLSQIGGGGAGSVKDEISDYVTVKQEASRSHAWALRHCTKAVEFTKRPLHEHLRLFDSWASEAKEGPTLARLVLPAYEKVLVANVRYVGQFRCACVGMSVERFRLTHKRWPVTLDELVKVGLLTRVPADPYDGKPLRFRKTADGVAVFSVGPKGHFRGDAWDRQPSEMEDRHVAQALEFRLWDTPQRGRPAPPWPKESDPDDPPPPQAP
jgi:hypothetical protein